MTDVTTDSPLASEANHDTGSFLTGFTIGLFAGAAGYFLFGTDRGGKVRRELMTEWENARGELVERGIVENPRATLRELVKDAVEEVVRKVGLATGKRKNNNSKIKAKPKSASISQVNDKKESSRKFKGD